MKKVLLFILMMVSTIVVAQTNLLGQSGFDGLEDVVSDCNGGANYDGSCNNGCPEVRQNPVTGGGAWFRCGGKADVTNLSGNDVARFLDGGSTPIRQLVEGLGTNGVYKISIKVSKTATNTTRPVTLTMKPFDNTNGDNLMGWSEITSNPEVTVNAGSVVINSAAYNSTGFTTFEFYYTAPQANVILQVQSTKEGSAGSGKDTYADDITMVLDPTASVQDLEKLGFSFYPNPSKDRLNLSAAKNIQQIELYNMLGQSVLSKDLNARKASLDISSLTKGVYIMKLAIEGLEGSYKIIKE